VALDVGAEGVGRGRGWSRITGTGAPGCERSDEQENRDDALVTEAVCMRETYLPSRSAVSCSGSERSSLTEQVYVRIRVRGAMLVEPFRAV
jgi:hypothetical protein